MPTEVMADVLAKDTTWAILRQLHDSRRSAKELRQACDSSLKTIYRRLEELQEAELVRAECRIDEAGNHYTAYTSTVDQVEITIEPGQSHIDVAVSEKDDVDQFIRVWKGLQE